MSTSTTRPAKVTYSSDEDSTYNLIDNINKSDAQSNQELLNKVADAGQQPEKVTAPENILEEQREISLEKINSEQADEIRQLQLLNAKQKREIEELKERMNSKKEAADMVGREAQANEKSKNKEWKKLPNDVKAFGAALAVLLLAFMVAACLDSRDSTMPIDVISVDHEDFFMSKDLQLKLEDDDTRIIDKAAKKSTTQDEFFKELKKSPVVFEKMRIRDVERIAKVHLLGEEARKFANDLIYSAKWLRFMSDYPLSDKNKEYKEDVLDLYDFKKLSYHAKTDFAKQFPITASIFQQVALLRTFELETRQSRIENEGPLDRFANLLMKTLNI